jgi:2-C-methyl-D-erythritol 4-phosphate cytidylyltransferase
VSTGAVLPDAIGEAAGIVVGAGRGERFGGSVPKALLDLGGRPLVAHAVRALQRAGVGPIAVAAPPGAEASVAEGVDGLGVEVVTGGETRQESVAAALAVLPTHARWVLVHDAARALAPVELVTSVLAALRGGARAVVPGLAVVDTIKTVEAGRVTGTVDRGRLVAVQTPQGFELDLLRSAHRRARTGSVTDDAGLMELMGVEVQVVAGSPRALKITQPLDLTVAETLLAAGERAAGR